MKGLTFETKSLWSQNSHVGHSNLILGLTIHVNLIDWNVDIFMYLIEGIRFDSWKDGCLNWA